MNWIWENSEEKEQLEDWPKDETGTPEEPVFLKHCSCVDMDDELTVNLLAASGVPSLRQYGDGTLVVLGMSAMGADIFVPKSLLADAQAILEGGGQENDEL